MPVGIFTIAKFAPAEGMKWETWVYLPSIASDIDLRNHRDQAKKNNSRTISFYGVQVHAFVLLDQFPVPRPHEWDVINGWRSKAQAAPPLAAPTPLSQRITDDLIAPPATINIEEFDNDSVPCSEGCGKSTADINSKDFQCWYAFCPYRDK